MSSAGRRLLLGVALGAACVPAVPAGAAGPPLPSSATGKAGVVVPGGHERFLARRAGKETLVVAVQRRDWRLLRSQRIGGRWTIAPATFDGAATGLSADERVLVLVRPERDFPPTETRLAVLDTGALSVRREISLPGFFTVDAISPDGRWVYLIHYEGQNVIDYRVRALDTRTGRFAARDVVDPREPDEQMGGLPFTREMSRDGRWAYTLYGGDEETFIHALDTARRTAACIDLEMLPPTADLSLAQLRLSADGRRLRVRNDGRLVATVDKRTFAVRDASGAVVTEHEPAHRTERAAAPRRATAQAADGDDFPWLLLLPAAALGAVLLHRLAFFQKS
jgi:hypothetical protein